MAQHPAARHPSLSDVAYDYLKNAILSGHYQPGDELAELVLTNVLNISRTPIKSALYRLAMDGMVEIVPNKGYYVRRFDIRDVVEITQAREALEGMAARLACEKMEPEDIAFLLTLFPIDETPYDPSKNQLYYDNGHLLHSFVLKKANNRIIARQLETFSYQVRQSALLSAEVKGRSACAYLEHINIVRALVNHNPEQSERTMREHLANVRFALIKSLVS